jgi:signal transduction histidine kinase
VSRLFAAVERFHLVVLLPAYVLLVLGGEVEWTRRSASPDDVPGPWPLAVGLALLQVVPQIWRRRVPHLLVPIAVAGYIGGILIGPQNHVMIVGVWWAAFTAALWETGGLTRYSYPVGLVAALLDVQFAERPVGLPPIAVPLLSAAELAAFILFGRYCRERRQRMAAIVVHSQQVELDHAAAELRAAVAERARIARDLHDILSHAVTVMVMRAESAARVSAVKGTPPSPEVLQTVAQLGREALTDLRRLLGVLRSVEEDNGTHVPAPTGPLPRLANLDSLVEQMRAAGLPVRVRGQGTAPAVEPSIDIAAYRIIQGALTNVLQHAGATPAEVTIAGKEDGLHLTVVNGPPCRAAPSGDSSGVGLVGMSERARMLGGWTRSGHTPDGGFQVTAWLPRAGVP